MGAAAGIFQRGETQAVALATLAPIEEAQMIDAYGGGEQSKRFILHYNFPPFSVGETGRTGGPGRREIGHGALAERSVEPVVPSEQDFRYAIRISSEIMESNGSTSMASVCAGTLALMDAGVPIKTPVAGISVGLVTEFGDSHQLKRYELLTDIIGSEDHFGDMDFKLCGTDAGVTGFQLDLKLPGISHKIMSEAIQRAKEARTKILDIIRGTLEKPRPELSKYAPRIETLKINPEKIGALIGPGGKTIKGIVAETGAEINIEDDGSVHIYATSGESMARAKEIISGMTREIEIGQTYQGRVVSTKEFGAFVEVLPGKDGLVHISELADFRVNRTEDVVKAGFVEKLIGRLGKIGPEEVQNYFLRLAQEKGFLETVFNSIQEGIIVTDSKGRITYLNDAACQLFGLEAEDSLGKRLDERVRGLDWNALSREGAVSRDMEIFYPTNRFINFYSVPLVIERQDFVAGDAVPGPGSATAATGERVGHAIILRDITESRRTEQQTIESERLNALTLLAAGVAHEIGNPLNSLNIHLQLIEREARKLDGAKGSELQESVEVSRAEVHRLDSIITQFLRAIRPTHPQLRPENINAIVEEAVRFLAPEIKDRDIVVEQELRSDLPLLELDRDQMKQAFYNVIKNSFEAMKARGILRIRTDKDDSHVIIRFTDTGGGMTPGNLSRVFEPYFTTKTSGTGLGLLIVRRIVREHGGELSIESSEGKGLTVTIRLPLVDRRVRLLEAGDSKSIAN